MELEKEQIREIVARDLTEILIRVGIIVILAWFSVRVLSPFVGLVLWGLILAVTLYPMHQRLATKVGDRQGWAATLIVLLGLALIGIPTVMLGSSFAGHIHDGITAVQNDTFQVPLPPASVAEWPLIGEKVHEFWALAARDLPAALKDAEPQLASLSRTLLATVASTASGILQFLGANLQKDDGRLLHHWMNGMAARSTDPEYYCTGCNLQTLFLITLIGGAGP